MVFLPKSNVKEIDLAGYGGEGVIRVRGQTAGSASELVALVMRLAKRDGINVTSIRGKDYENLFVVYTDECAKFLVKKCARLVEDGKERELTDEEVASLPLSLFTDIRTAVEEADSFPLGRNAGEGTK